MNDSLPNPRPWWPWLSLLALAGVIGFAVIPRDQEREAVALPEAKSAPKEAKPSAPPSATVRPETAVTEAATDFSAALPAAIPAGHEGHGPECAACVAERGLAVCREDYAQMEYARLSGELEADEAQAKALLENCRRFAAAVVKEWSHANSRPVMPADAIVAARRQEILAPILDKIPHKASAP